ncbi:hypothetical protein [Methylorubrum extorquens]|uniref:hypothetical protein n=1 Tax=Methylorubrum extorquens TaxID=408 RepID=UPI0020A0233E|nr:hypothetical protein [Methylorubrum extorquens]MCP1538089.1 hypothetical protein [Methylorubrum extorquens]
MKITRIALVLGAALLAASPASALDRVLGVPRIKDNGDILLAPDAKIDRMQAGKYLATPEALQIQGAGSTGSIDGMTVSGTPLATVTATTAYMPPPSGSATTDAANFAAAMDKGTRLLLLQSGTYLVPPAGYAQLRSALEVIGQGSGQTTLRLTAQGTYSDGMLFALEKSDIVVRGLTLDYGGFPEPVSTGAVLGFRNGAKVRVEDVNLAGYSRYGFTANGGSDIRYDRGRIIRSATPRAADGTAIAAGQQNQCVLTSESAGAMSAVTFADVYCKGSAFNTSGTDFDYIRTEVDGFDFGFAYVTEQGANSVRHRFDSVKAHGGRTNPATGQDVNATVAGCFEIWSPGTVVTNSDCYDVGGDGVSLGGKNSRITNNRFSKLGMQVAANGIVSRYEAAGAYSADGSIVSGNTVVNSNETGDGSNLTNSYYEQDLTGNMTVDLFANNFGAKALARKSL